jgi:hypothetical protein
MMAAILETSPLDVLVNNAAADFIARTTTFVQAVRRAERAGFDLVEIHGAHGHLLNALFSPLANFREESDGVSLDNRRRFPPGVVAAIRAAPMAAWAGCRPTRRSRRRAPAEEVRHRHGTESCAVNFHMRRCWFWDRGRRCKGSRMRVPLQGKRTPRWSRGCGFSAREPNRA